MKKGVIVDRRGDKAIVLTKDGGFIEVKSAEAQIGDSIAVGNYKNRWMAIASVFMFLLVAGGSGAFAGVKVRNTPVAYVAIDINPSIEFTTNSQNRVLTVNAANEDGEIVIADEEFVGKRIDEVLKSVVTIAAETGYINLPNKSVEISNENISNVFNAVMITVISDSDKAAQSVKQMSERSVNNFFKNNDIFGLVLTQDGNYNYRDEAMQNEISIGKMQLIKVVEDRVSLNEAKEMPVKDIVRLINQKHTEQDSEPFCAEYCAQKAKYKNVFRDRYKKYICDSNKTVRKQLNDLFEEKQSLLLELISEDWDKIMQQWQPPCKITAA